MITLSQLKKPDKTMLEHINLLLRQLSDKAKSFSLRELTAITKQESVFILVAKEKSQIIGMGTVYVVQTFSGMKACIEDVVVDEGFRGRGIGTMITQELIDLAKKQKANYLDLTSKPQRVAANRLYKQLGFQLRNTNAYRLYLA